MKRKIDVKLSEVFQFCECSNRCMERADQKHHLLSNSKVNRKLYGDLLDHDKNIEYVNHNHHAEMPNISEIEFCKLLGIEPRSEVLKSKKF